MSTTDPLSHVEIDVLLNSVNDSKIERDDNKEKIDSVKTFDLTNQDRIIRGRMPNLDIIFERLASHFQISAKHFFKRTVKVSHSEIQVQKFSDFIKNVDTPSNFNIVHLLPLKGEAVILIEPALVFTAVNQFFGGDNNNDSDYYEKINKQEFSTIEHRVIQLIMNLLFKDIEKAWKPVFDINLEPINSEVNPNLVNIANPTENVVISTLKMEIAGGSGNISMAIPYAMLEPIRDSLDTVQSDQRNIDSDWQANLRKEVLKSEILINSTLVDKKMSVKDVMNFKNGDIIPINLPDSVAVNADDMAIFSGKVGILDGSYAIQITKKITNNFG